MAVTFLPTQCYEICVKFQPAEEWLTEAASQQSSDFKNDLLHFKLFKYLKNPNDVKNDTVWKWKFPQSRWGLERRTIHVWGTDLELGSHSIFVCFAFFFVWFSFTVQAIAQDNQNSWYAEVYFSRSNSESWAVWMDTLHNIMECNLQNPTCVNIKGKWPNLKSKLQGRKKVTKVETCRGGRRMVSLYIYWLPLNACGILISNQGLNSHCLHWKVES